MTLHTQSATDVKTISDLVAYESNPNFTRGIRTVAPGADTEYPVGTLLADDGTGTAIEIAPAASDGTEVLVGIVIQHAFVEAGQTYKLLTLENGEARIKAETIVWPAGITAPQQAAIEAQIKALNIKIVSAVGATN